ncbi:MAG: cytochrome c family protein, partial [Pseudomonadota bacterium]
LDIGAAGGPVKPKLPEPIMHLMATADIAKGEKLSKACAACHSFDNGGPHKVGPNIYNIVGAPKGAKSGYSYSAVMANFGGAWGYEELNFFMWKPKTYMPGTKMNYAGLKKPEDRAAIIGWLRTQGSNGFALPSEAEIAAEAAKLAPPEVEEAVEEVQEAIETATDAVEDSAAE